MYVEMVCYYVCCETPVVALWLVHRNLFFVRGVKDSYHQTQRLARIWRSLGSSVLVCLKKGDGGRESQLNQDCLKYEAM